MHVIKQKNGKAVQSSQRGFVLVMAMVLLAAMTLLGISSMNGASMELKSAANSRQHQIAFNGAYSLLEYTLAAGTKRTDAKLIDWQTTSTTAQAVTYALANTSLLQASIVYEGCSSGAGSSLVSGKGVSYNFYNVSASGSNALGTSTSLQNQGVRYPSASCGSI